MRAVTELGFIASIAPERNTVQEAPQSGESFFDTLRKANETAGEAEKVTDDKPETAAQDNDAADMKTEETETEEKTEKTEETEETEETEQVQEHDVAAEMMALGRMFTVAVEEGNVLENRAGSPNAATVQAVTGDAQGGEQAQTMEQLLTPVENGEEVIFAEAQEGNVSVDAQSFADTITQTLTENLDTVQTQPTMNEQPAAPAVPNAQHENVPAAEIQPQQAEGLETQAQPVQTNNEAAAVLDAAEQVSPKAKTEVQSFEIPESEEAPELNTQQTAVSPADGENTDFAESFDGQQERDTANTETAETLEVQLPEAEIPMMETLRNRFSLDNAVQQIDNTELAQAIEKAIERFAEDFRLAEVDTQQITIRLDPEELGSVAITVASENNALTAKIVTDNKEAASLLAAQIEQFLETMEQRGIKVEKAEVVYNSQLDLGGQAAGENQGGRRDESRAVQGISAVEMVEAEEAGRLDEEAAAAIAAVQDEATNYYVFDDKYVPSHVYKV